MELLLKIGIRNFRKKSVICKTKIWQFWGKNWSKNFAILKENQNLKENQKFKKKGNLTLLKTKIS